MEYIIGIAVVAVFAGVMYLFMKKENEELEKMVSNLTEEQKNTLKDNQVENYDEKKHTWTQRGMIGNVKDKGNKVKIQVLWYNTVMQNHELNTITLAAINMKKDVFELHGLKAGSYVKVFINPEAPKAEIIFD